ncbi:HAD family hydrolase [Thermoflexibacter ruber]|uniref:Putative hydrolase of the HAD superfamily n=1 Tax=Thermoflexibacter ruber TaxID=1003 RepID=A0A1I2ED57_9BACT|nr:HAD family phosphatase [Thermoflexibacter ruber]SFE90170.1 putative hydrolase of the HAD superfamily [Thermoflexibacter ruber]
MLTKYTTIIFDLGGVIINLEEKRTVEAFRRLSKLAEDDFYAMYKPTSYSFSMLENYETGKVSNQDFRNAMRKILHIEAEDHAIDHAWNQILGDIPQERIDLLKKLVNSHQTMLLSNTNDIHRLAFDDILHQQAKIKFTDLFHKVYYSYEMQDRKPNLSIYRRILEENKLKPSETLFIDDNMKNVVAARRLGIHAVHLVPPVTINQLLG